MTFEEFAGLLKYLNKEHTYESLLYNFSLVKGELKVEKDERVHITDRKQKRFMQIIKEWKIDNKVQPTNFAIQQQPVLPIDCSTDFFLYYYCDSEPVS